MDSRDETTLSCWTGEFLDSACEQAFQADAWPRLCRQLRLIALIAGSVYIAALYLNWAGFGDGLAFRTMAALRLGTGLTFWGIALVSRPSSPPTRVHVLFLVTILFMVTTRLVETHLTGPQASPGTPSAVPVLPVMPLVIFAVIAIPARLAVVWSGVGSVLFLRDQVALRGIEAPVTQVLLLYLLLANGVGYAFRVAWNRITRRDYTLRQALEREVLERQRAEQEARKADAAKGRFLTVMSHEIRTPLNGVLGGVQLLQESALLPEQRQPLDIVSRCGNQLAMLLDDILDLARIGAGRLDLTQESFSPAELLTNVHAVLCVQARSKGLVLRLEHPAELPAAVHGDALRLRQILINLVGNAVKFAEHGEVVLALLLDEVADRPGFRRCSFTVRDTGPGLDEEAKARIFAPFEQGDMSMRRRHGGAGLGLAISRELVAAMGGELTVESTKGQGSSFRFALVLPVGETLVVPVLRSGGAKSLSVLVVDDLEVNRIVAKGLLENLGHHPRAASTGHAALEELQTHAFDAVLLDLHMLDMDGLEVLRRIRCLPDRRTANLPVFLATADTERTSTQACLAAGAAGVLPKPIRKSQLADFLAGVPATAEWPAEVPLVDMDYVAQLQSDLGPMTWAAGLQACQASANECLEHLADTDRIKAALHRLAGLSGSYGLPRLHQHVRDAETLVATGLPCPLEELRTLVAASLECLESNSPAPFPGAAIDLPG